MIYRVVTALWLMLFIAAITSACMDLPLARGHHTLIIGLLAFAGYLLFIFRPIGSIGGAWSVTVDDQVIATSDGRSPPVCCRYRICAGWS